MKKWIILITIIVLFTATSNAQKVGHLGKRFLVNFDCTFSPSYFQPDFNGYHGYFQFNYRVNPGIEFIFSRKRTIGVTYTFSKTQFCPSLNLFQHSILYPDLFIQGFGINYKKYIDYYSKSKAPYGTYIMLSVNRIYYNYYSDIIGNGKGKTVALQLELGYNYLLFDRLRLSWGVAIGGTIDGFFVNLDGVVPVGLNPDGPDSFAKNRLFGTYFFGTKIGIGFLAF